MLVNTVRSSFSNQGEICLCGSRLFVERPVYEQFKDDFISRVSNLKVGDPLEAETDVGAIVSKQHFDKIMSYIDLAQSEGGTILTGGKQVILDGRCADGWFIEPTVIEGLPYDCRTNQEEIFGPTVTIMPFDTEGEGLAYANSVRYGLSTTVLTENLSRSPRVPPKLESTRIWINF